MATVEQVTKLYQDILGRAPDPEGLNYWVNSGQSIADITKAFETSNEAIVNRLYREQLGRQAEAEGAQYWQGRLAAGATEQEINQAIARSLEGQNLDTQLATSAYRQLLGRNPEQEGYQYWMSLAQAQGLTTEQLREAIAAGAIKEQQERGITDLFTEMRLPDLEADPFGGRRATTSIYDIPADVAEQINISTINGIPVQFVNPVTQQAVISAFNQGQFTATPGEETLSIPRVEEAINRALAAGSLTDQEYRDIVNSLTTATLPSDIRQILQTPTGYVVIDPKYGQQIGEDELLAAARQEAAQRQAVLSAQDPGYYQASDVLGQAYIDAGLQFPFMPNPPTPTAPTTPGDTTLRDALTNAGTVTGLPNVVPGVGPGYKAETMMTRRDELNQQNFNERVNQLITQLTGTFGQPSLVPTTLGGQYYSETGLQPGFTPFGTDGTMFRSGVAGYTPNLPRGFDFGAPAVNATFQQYRPGAFQPEGVTTGGFITGYTQAGQPIYSSYANPSVTQGAQTAPTLTATGEGIMGSQEFANAVQGAMQNYYNQQYVNSLNTGSSGG